MFYPASSSSESETPNTRLSARPAAWFTCYGGCDERYPLDEVHYRCARCGGLLDVEHDLIVLSQRSAAAWKALFAERAAPRVHFPPAFPHSGVWDKREWVCPVLDASDVVSLGEGWTPLLPAPALGEALGLPELLVKQCGHSHTGSFKDLGMTVLVSMVRRMRSRGVRIPAVACASAGDTSAALAAYCARAGIPALVFLPAGKITDEQLIQPIAHFALTVSVDTDFDGCMRLVAAFCQKHGVYLANSMNPLRMEGQKTLAAEICQQLGWEVPDWIVVPGGNLGNVTAIGKGFAMLRSLGLVSQVPRLVVAQAENASPLHRAFQDGWRFHPVQAGPTQASAIQIGDPVNVHKAIATLKETRGLVDAATEDEISRACLLGDRHGLYTDPHTGVALAVADKLARAGTIGRHDRVVVISTAHGLKFGGLKRGHHLGEQVGEKGDPAGLARNRPLSLPASLEAAERALLPLLERSQAPS